MQLLQDGVIAALAAVGLATIVWFTVTALTHPRERVRSETAVIVPARGAAEALEHTVRTLESERYASGGFSRIIIADCGMDEDAQRVAQLLCRESFDVTVCPQGDLARQFDRDPGVALTDGAVIRLDENEHTKEEEHGRAGHL